MTSRRLFGDGLLKELQRQKRCQEPLFGIQINPDLSLYE